jgi:hypothetical protein
MSQIDRRVIANVLLSSMLGLALSIASTWTIAEPTGEECRKQICDATVVNCMHTDQPLNPLARTEAEKKSYCGQFIDGCMERYITPDLPWYSPDDLARFMRCPSRSK